MLNPSEGGKGRERGGERGREGGGERERERGGEGEKEPCYAQSFSFFDHSMLLTFHVDIKEGHAKKQE